MPTFFDSLETRSADERAADLAQALRDLSVEVELDLS